MHYNPSLFRWEGNENELAPFDVPDFHPRGLSPSSAERGSQGSPNGKANVALISNIGNVSGVQVVGGMVFDPAQMRWLKMTDEQDWTQRQLPGRGRRRRLCRSRRSKRRDEMRSQRSSAVTGGLGQQYGLAKRDRNVSADSARSRGSAEGHSSDDAFGGNMAEEYDVGPEFIRRQRSEEERWKRKVEKWLRSAGEDEATDDAFGGVDWRWNIRELVRGME